MPFIEEEKLVLMQEDLDNNKLKREEAENELSETQKILTSSQKKSKITTILLGLLLGLSLGACYYFYTNTGGATSFSEDDIAVIKNKENSRVLDSVKRANIRALRALENSSSTNSNSGIDSENLENTIDEVKNNTTGETMYSVQIGVLYDKKFPLLSSKTIPSIITSKDGYFKYSLGLFTTLEEAKELRQELITLGIEDAFVASYIDGKRQKIHD
ncbi:hypothetical protein [Tenacibaculum salmonis]|uniref:hypothetical protein n=1 Tax=Tenacibaculum sp. P3-BQ1 TaxID=3232310 RepID=UPI0034DFA211